MANIPGYAIYDYCQIVTELEERVYCFTRDSLNLDVV